MVSASQLKAEMVRLDMKKATPSYMLFTKTTLNMKTKMKVYKRGNHANSNKKTLEWLSYYQSKSQSKEYYQGQKSSLLNGKGVNSPKRE